MKLRRLLVIICAILLLLPATFFWLSQPSSSFALTSNPAVTTSMEASPVPTPTLVATLAPTVAPTPTPVATLVPTAAPTPVPAATLAPTSIPTSTPKPASAATRTTCSFPIFCIDIAAVTSTVQAANGLISSATSLITLVIAIFLVIFLAWRIWILWYAPTLVVDSFNNATGDGSLDKVLTGLNQLTRQALAERLKQLGTQIKKKKEKEALYAEPLSPTDSFPLPEAASPNQITTLLASLQGVTSPGPIQTAIVLLNFLLAPRGTKISTTLQTQGDTHVTFGMSFEVSDLQNKQRSILYTFWEPASASLPQTIRLQPLSSTASLPQTDPGANGNNQPPHEVPDKDTQASYTLGHIYEESGALTDALNQYKKALAQQPDNGEAQKALEHILQTVQTPEDRLRTYVIPAAACWLEAEVAQRTIESDELRWRTSLRYFLDRLFRQSTIVYSTERRKAILYNYIGSVHQTSAQAFYTYPDYYEFFYKRAIERFTQSIDHYTAWFQPYENLAYAYTMLAQEHMLQRLQGPARQATISSDAWSLDYQDRLNLYQGVINYDKACYYFQHPQGDGFVEGQNSTRQLDWLYEIAPERLAVMRRILVGQASSQLLLGDRSGAVHSITLARFECAESGSGKIWDLASEHEPYVLYNLGCWYAKADRQHAEIAEVLIPDATAKEAALRYITYSLARNPNRDIWAWLPNDPALSNISNDDGWKRLMLALTEKQYELYKQGMNLALLTGNEFKDEIEAVLLSVTRKVEIIEIKGEVGLMHVHTDLP